MDQSYRERLPLPQLARDVSCVWIQQVGLDEPPYEHRTVPNGCTELAYALGGTTVTAIGTRRGPDVARLAPGSTVVGVRCHTTWIRLPPPLRGAIRADT